MSFFAKETAKDDFPDAVGPTTEMTTLRFLLSFASREADRSETGSSAISFSVQFIFIIASSRLKN